MIPTREKPFDSYDSNLVLIAWFSGEKEFSQTPPDMTL